LEFNRDYSIVHVHPTLSCNLSCSHCYSSSSPKQKGGLEINALLNYLKSLKENMGYSILSISGGEPFLYKDLKKLVNEAKEFGYYVQLVSNGMLFNSARNNEILNCIDSIALSIDGMEVLHNFIRKSDNAFQKLLEGIEILNQLNIEFGLIHTVTSKSWKQIPELIEFAIEHKAKLLQFHPIERTGRAIEELNNEYDLTEDELYRIYILTNIIKETTDDIKIHLDLLHQKNLNEDLKCSDDIYNSLLSKIVITESGSVIPISYGFSKYFEIHNIYDTNKRTFDFYKETNLIALNEIVNKSIRKIREEKISLFNWTEIMVNQSQDITQHYDRITPTS